MNSLTEKDLLREVQAAPDSSSSAASRIRAIVASYARMGVSKNSLREFVRRPQKSAGMRIAWASHVAECPEKRLVIAVIDQAVEDMIGFDEREKGRARRFFESGDFDVYLGCLGVDADYGRECVNDALSFFDQ